MPIVIAGTRVAAVSSISLVAVGQLIGQGGLGADIIRGYQLQFQTQIVAATVLIILLALVTDAILVIVQRVLTPWAQARGVRVNDLWSQFDLFWTWLTASSQWHGADGIPHRLLQHIYYSGVSLAFAAVIGLALGLLIGHTGRGGFLAITLANFARAIPTFGLILFIVVIEYSITPVLIALVALAVPPILVNTYEGIRGVDADAKDAARGMGMTGWGVLWRAELPMALPLILLGLRDPGRRHRHHRRLSRLRRPRPLHHRRAGPQRLPARHRGTVLVVLLALIVQLVFAALRRVVISPGLLGSARSS